jgi:WD40 repeat protein
MAWWRCEFKAPGIVRDQHMSAAPLHAVRFHPRGKQLAYATWDRSVNFASLDSDAETPPPLAAQGQPRCIAFDRQGKVFAVTWGDGQLGVYDAATGALLRTRPIPGANQDFQWMSVALSPDGRRLATLGANHAIEVYDLQTDQPPTVLGHHRDGVRGLCFSSDGRLLASASMDRTAKIWKVDGGGEPLTLFGHTNRVNAVALAKR